MYIFSPNSLNKIYSTTSINSNLHSNIYSSRPRTATKHRSSFTRSKFDLRKILYMYIYKYIYTYIYVYIFIYATVPRAQERVLGLTSASKLLASFDLAISIGTHDSTKFAHPAALGCHRGFDEDGSARIKNKLSSRFHNN
jgi:hypothetical protein